jgi:hypothetical protein
MRIEMHHLERYIEEMVFLRADSPELRAAIATKAEDIDDSEKQLRQAIADDERRLRRAEEEYDDDEITKSESQRRRRRILERVEANEAALAEATKSRVHTRLVLLLSPTEEVSHGLDDRGLVFRVGASDGNRGDDDPFCRRHSDD